MKPECVKWTHFTLGGGGTAPTGARSGSFWFIYKMKLLLSIGVILLEGYRTFRRPDIAERCKSPEGMLPKL